MNNEMWTRMDMKLSFLRTLRLSQSMRYVLFGVNTNEIIKFGALKTS